MKLDVKVQTEQTKTRFIRLDRDQVFDILCTSLGFDKEETKLVAQGLNTVTLIETCNSTEESFDPVFVMRSRE